MKKPGFDSKLVLSFIFCAVNISLHSNAYCQVTKEWETESVFFAPESVVFDSLRNCLYVSNYNDKGGHRKKGDKLKDECISKLDTEGNIVELRWLDGLLGPTGIAIFNDQLFIVERDGLSIADIDKRTIKKRVLIDSAEFLNDVAIDKNGIAYVSDTRNHCIYRIENNSWEMWLTDSLINNPNGLLIDGDHLYVGVRGDSVNLISVSLEDKKINVVARNTSPNVDGIRKLNDYYLLSCRTEFYTLDSERNKTLLFKSEVKDNLADFEFIELGNLVVVPRLLSNTVIAFKIQE